MTTLKEPEAGLRADPKIAEMLKAIGHPVRLAIVHELARRNSCCCGDMCDCFPLSQSTVSQHLSVMKEAGILVAERDGNRSRFRLNSKAFEVLKSEFARISADLGADKQ